MVLIIRNNTKSNRKIADKYFFEFRGIGDEDAWGGMGFGLQRGFFGTGKIGHVQPTPTGLTVNIYESKYINHIKKICEEIEEKEKITIRLKINN